MCESMEPMVSPSPSGHEPEVAKGIRKRRFGRQRSESAPTLGIKLLRGLRLPGISLLALVLYEGFARGSLPEVWTWLWDNPLMFVVNYGLLLGVFLVLSVLPAPGRGLCTVLLLGVLGAVGIVNDYKVRFRFEPVLLTDIFQLGNVRATLEGFSMSIRWMPIILLGLGVVSGVICCLLLPRRKIAFRKRILPCVVGAILFGMMGSLCTFENPYVKTRTDLVDYSRAGGGLYTMIAMEQRRRDLFYSGYTPEAAQSAYQQVQALAGEDKETTPNIIFILSESFTDQAHLSPYLAFAQPLTPFYNELIQSTVSGSIYVPKQGGGTSETEFEVLTGLSSEYAINPYSAGLPQLHSVAATLRERGYRATTLHWYSGVFYNRYQNLRQLGFDEFHTTDTSLAPFEKKGMFVSDEEHYRAILQKLRQTEEKDFVFCLTMQNHFPYDQEELDALRGDTLFFSNDLAEEHLRIAANYCYLINQSDTALKTFIEALSEFEEPTMVVFFGDHIPALGDSLYAEIEMPVQTEIGHLTPYLIWSNQEDIAPRQEDMQAWQLGAFALAEAGIESDPFFSYVETLRKSGENRDDCYELLTYDALYGKQAAYRSAGFEILSRRWEIGGEMRMTGVYAEQIGDRIYIVPTLADNSQAFRLSVNGQLLDNWCIRPSDEPITIQCVLSNYKGTMYNHSNSLTFDSTDDLLTRTKSPQGLTLSLGQLDFAEPEVAGSYVKVTTLQRFATQAAAVMVDGQRIGWQPSYALTRGGRFFVPIQNAFQQPKAMSLTLNRKDLDGYALTGEGASQYMEDHGGSLILLGGYTLLR